MVDVEENFSTFQQFLRRKANIEYIIEGLQLILSEVFRSVDENQ